LSGQEREPFLLHAARRTANAAHLEIKINFVVAAAEIARPAPLPVIEARIGFSAAAADGFF
jgi:hypothetical protein